MQQYRTHISFSRQVFELAHAAALEGIRRPTPHGTAIHLTFLMSFRLSVSHLSVKTAPVLRTNKGL